MSKSTRSAASIAAALLLALPFAACSHDEASHGSAAAGGKSASALLEEATAMMGSDEWKGALAKVDLVLADGKATAQEKSEAWQAKVVCEGRVNGDDAAIAALSKLTEAKVELTPNQYAKMGNDLAEADRLKAALAVIERATEKYKHDPTAKKQLGRLASMLGKKLEAAGDSDSQKKLKALGYLGGSSEDEEAPPAKKSDGPTRN
jgi:secreted PhoX family phosphatase